MRRAGLFLLLLSWIPAAPAAAAFSTNYGDCSGGGTLEYQQVSESNAGSGALYNAPTCSGNAIDFDPTGFEANDSSLEGMLEFTVQAAPSFVLTSITLDEDGDRQVFGFSPSTTYAEVTLSIDLTIFIPDGGGELGLAYSDVQSLLFEVPADSSSGAESWSLGASFEMDAILASACAGTGQYSGAPVPQACGAQSERVDVEISNLLEAFADSGELAFINKKDSEGVGVALMVVAIPEPSSALLLSCGLVALGIQRRRRG